MSQSGVQPAVSVVVSTCNRATPLRTCLAALRHQTYGSFEVVVVNGPSTDDTETVVRENPDVKAGHCPELNLSMSRNIGIAMAAGEYVAFIDDDGIAEPTWIEELVRCMGKASQVAAVGGYTKDPSGVTFQAKRIVCDRLSNGQICDFSYVPQYPHAFRFPAPIGCNCMFRRDALLQIGAFDEQYDYFLDETDVCARLIDAGYTVDFTPRASMIHKFAKSHLRDQRRVMRDWSKIVKNTVYYVRQYESALDREVCDQVLAEKVAAIRRLIKAQAFQGDFTEEEAQEIDRTVDAGLEQGRKDCARGTRLLISEETLTAHRKPFKPFVRRGGDAKPLTIVFLADAEPSVRQKAVSLAKLGQNVHVVTPGGESPDTVDFEDEVWVHRIVFKDYPDHLLERDTAACAFPQAHLRELYSYYAELLKIEERVHVDVVETPIGGDLGFYPRFDSRFKMVVAPDTCLDQEEQLAFYRKVTEGSF